MLYNTKQGHCTSTLFLGFLPLQVRYSLDLFHFILEHVVFILLIGQEPTSNKEKVQS